MSVNIDLLKHLIVRRNERLDELFGLERLVQYDRYKDRADSMNSWAKQDDDWRKRSMKKAAYAKKHGDTAGRRKYTKDALLARRNRKADKAKAAEIMSQRDKIIKSGKSPIW